MQRVIFLDRDGVINKLVLGPNTNEHIAPHKPEDFKLLSGVIQSLKDLCSLGYKLILVSNQPDYAKGKTTLENLKLVHQKMHSMFTTEGITFSEYNYCYHHPQGIVKELSIKCKCRKPGNLFLLNAKEKYGLEMSQCWMMGDRDVDIYCGQSSGTKTILISSKDIKPRESKPDFKVKNLEEAVITIKKVHNGAYK